MGKLRSAETNAENLKESVEGKRSTARSHPGKDGSILDHERGILITCEEAQEKEEEKTEENEEKCRKANWQMDAEEEKFLHPNLKKRTVVRLNKYLKPKKLKMKKKRRKW